MINLYIYPNARKHFERDKLDYLFNTTPFSDKGIQDHCKIVDSNEAEYFYMGQISCGTFNEFKESDFQFLKNNERKHIVEIEGDWYGKKVPQWLLNCICTGNGDRTYYTSYKFFTRPCLSRLLVHLAKNKLNFEITYPDKVSFGFKGQHDPYQTRLMLYHTLNHYKITNEIYFNSSWSAQVDLKKDNELIQSYAGVMQRNILSLCPRGVGEDSSRFYETCFFGRVPVIVGYPKILDEYKIKKPFYFRIDPNLTKEEIGRELLKIANTPRDELIAMCKDAKKYFENNVRDYFTDPTKYFLNFLKYDIN